MVKLLYWIIFSLKMKLIIFSTNKNGQTIVLQCQFILGRYTKGWKGLNWAKNLITKSTKIIFIHFNAYKKKNMLTLQETQYFFSNVLKKKSSIHIHSANECMCRGYVSKGYIIQINQPQFKVTSAYLSSTHG